MLVNHKPLLIVESVIYKKNYHNFWPALIRGKVSNTAFSVKQSPTMEIN